MGVRRPGLLSKHAYQFGRALSSSEPPQVGKQSQWLSSLTSLPILILLVLLGGRGPSPGNFQTAFPPLSFLVLLQNSGSLCRPHCLNDLGKYILWGPLLILKLLQAPCPLPPLPCLPSKTPDLPVLRAFDGGWWEAISGKVMGAIKDEERIMTTGGG